MLRRDSAADGGSWRPRLLAFGAGLIAALLIALLLELVCGRLLYLYGPFREDYFQRERLKRRTMFRDNREALGVENTRLGVFPSPPPPVPRRQLFEHRTERITEFLSTPYRVGRVGPGPLRLPLSSYRSFKKFRDQVVWDVTYTIDRFHRRKTPGESSKKEADQFLLLFGDSRVFGYGVRSEQTLAAYLGKELSRYRVYNYGIAGLFPGEMLERIRLIRGAPEILEKKGVVVYFYLDYHILRNMGALSALNGSWARRKPYYFENTRGEIVAERSWAQERPFRTFLAGIFEHSDIVRYFNIDWPTKPSDSDFRFQIRLLQQMREEARRLGCDRFYVALFPHYGGATCSSFIPYLERAHIPYIDLSHWQMGAMTRGPAWIPHDGHPTAETNRLWARELAEFIRQF